MAGQQFKALKLAGNDGGIEVMAIALYFEMLTGQDLADQRLNVFWCHKYLFGCAICEVAAALQQRQTRMIALAADFVAGFYQGQRDYGEDCQSKSDNRQRLPWAHISHTKEAIAKSVDHVKNRIEV